MNDRMGLLKLISWNGNECRYRIDHTLGVNKLPTLIHSLSIILEYQASYWAIIETNSANGLFSSLQNGKMQNPPKEKI